HAPSFFLIRPPSPSPPFPTRRSSDLALQRFVGNALDASRTNLFLADFHDLVASIAPLGAISSLSQLVLKLTVPGVPDIYQGGELDRKSTRLNSSHVSISYAVFCLKKK